MRKHDRVIEIYYIGSKLFKIYFIYMKKKYINNILKIINNKV